MRLDPCSVRAKPNKTQETAGRQIGSRQMGSTLMGPQQKQLILTDWGKGTPWHFWEDQSRLTGIPTQSPSVEKHRICSDPISADPIRPFPHEE